MAIQVKAERRAHATWEGDLMSGTGRFTLGSGAIDEQEVTWASRTEESEGKTSPEELIAAALASCFSMALSHGLAEAGHAPTRLETDTVATFERTGEGFRMTRIDVKVRGEVEGVDEDAFREAAEQAKVGCPVSNALKGNVELSLDASLA
jgi:osmotically inducible protein OsmC